MSPTDNIDLMYWMGLLIGLLGISTGIFIGGVIYRAFRSPAQNLSDSLQLAGRKKEIRRLAGQVLTGQSSAIVSVFEEDRTALLGHLSDPGYGKELYGEQADKLIFSLLDIHWLFLQHPTCQPEQFWEHALKPLTEEEEKFDSNSSVLKIYHTCQENQFEESCLDKLILQLKQEGLRLVLMLDRFDELLGSDLGQPSFFATLRYLASYRSPSSLSLIISGNISLKQFHEKTKEINSKASPYFNFMESGEMVLGNLSDSEVNELLNEMSFSKSERQFIQEIAGWHPHFLQLATSALQFAKENKAEQPLVVAQQDFYDRVENMLANIIQSWDFEVCRAIVALVKENKPLGFFNEGISLLEKQGFLRKDSQNQWQVSPRVLVDFINNKMEQELCKD